jgi:hypothetical protein
MTSLGNPSGTDSKAAIGILFRTTAPVPIAAAVFYRSLNI